MGEKLLRSAHGMYVSAQPDVRNQSKIMHHLPVGKSFLSKPDPVQIRVITRLCQFKVRSRKIPECATDGTAQWNRDRAGGWEDIQFVPQATQKQQPANQNQLRVMNLHPAGGKNP